MTLTFADTHNMIAYLIKFDASKGFNQIIDFLNESSIKYALTVNPNIYVLCIKQFWTTVAVKKVNDVTRLQALVNKKKVVVTEATIRDTLHLDDAEGVEFLPNEEIFTGLARMGYEKPSTKLTFYKAFVSSQWKFMIHTILQYMSAKRTLWNEFSSSMASDVICLSSVGNLFSHSTKYTSPALTQKVFANMGRVCKGFSGVDTPLFKGMLVVQEVGEGDADEVNAEDVNADGVVAEGATGDDVNAAVDEPSIPSPTPPTPPPQPSQDIPSTSQLKQRVKKLEKRNKLKVLKLKRLKRVGSAQRIDTSYDTFMDDVSKQGGIIANIYADEDVVLEDVAVKKSVDVEDNADIQGRTAESQAQIYQIDLEHANKVLSMQDEEESKLNELQEVVDVVTTAKIITEVVSAASDTITTASTTITAADVPIPAATTDAASTLTAAPSRRRKGVVIRDPEETTTTSTIIHSEAKSKDKETKEQMDEEYSRALKRLNESKKDKTTKKQKLDEEVKELKRHLQIVPNDEDDVYTEATSLALKVPVIDYEIYDENNKPYNKIKKADGSHQLYLSFLSLLRTFDREDLEALWILVKERFATTKPKNFFDDFLLITLGAMFEKPDIHAQIRKNQRSVHGQAKVKSWKLLESCGVQIITFTTTQLIMLVERRYPLTRFTLDQKLNNVRLKVEEESKVSLELLRFI
nr:xylulose kinase-1 [Tanacetum cinerariifolium]